MNRNAWMLRDGMNKNNHSMMVVKVKKLNDSPKVKQIDEAAKKYADKPDEKAAAIAKIMEGISELTGDMESQAEDSSEQTNVCPHCGETLN